MGEHLDANELQGTIIRHGILITELTRRVEHLEESSKQIMEGFALINQSLGELKSELRVRFEEARQVSEEKRQTQALMWSIIVLILSQIVIAGFELLKR